MKKYFAGFPLFILLALTGRAADPAASATPAAAWKEYSYKEDLMAFSMPGEPDITTQNVVDAGANIAVRLYTLKANGYVLLITANTYPPSLLGINKPEQIMKGARDGALDSMKAKVVSAKQITIDKNPGIEFEFASGAVHGIMRVYFVGAHLYQVCYAITADKALPPDGDRFLNSFHLLKP